MELSREFDTYKLERLGKLLNVHDWIDVILIGIQITTTYEIQTKYYENMRSNKYKYFRTISLVK